MTEYFILGGVELQIEVTPAIMDYRRNTLVKPFLSYPGSHTQTLDGDGKKIKFTAVVVNNENLETIRGFWKQKTPLPLVSLNEQAGYNVLFVITEFVQKDYDSGLFRFEIELQEYSEWNPEKRDFVNWKVSTPAAKPKCPKATNSPKIGVPIKAGGTVTIPGISTAINAATNEKACVTQSSSYSSQLNKCPTLKKNINSKSCVETLQKALRTHGFYLKYNGRNTVIDGYFGPITYDAVWNFQKKNKLVMDGIVGPKTKAKL